MIQVPFYYQHGGGKYFLPVLLIDVLKHSSIQQTGFVFQGKEDDGSATAGRRTMRADEESGSFDRPLGALLFDLLVGEYPFVSQFRSNKLQGMPGGAEA